MALEASQIARLDLRLELGAIEETSGGGRHEPAAQD
jgi:hypothetical protein